MIDLKDLVQSYLDEKPDVEVAKGLRDMITLMTEADHKVTLEEGHGCGRIQWYDLVIMSTLKRP